MVFKPVFDPVFDPVLEPLLESVLEVPEGLGPEAALDEGVTDPCSVTIEEFALEVVEALVLEPDVCEPGFAESDELTEEPDLEPTVDPEAVPPFGGNVEPAADPGFDCKVEPAADPGREREDPAVDVMAEPDFERLVEPKALVADP